MVNGKVEEILTYLGMSWNSRTDEILVKEKWIPRKLLSDNSIKNLVWKNYQNGNKEWKWKIHRNSWLIEHGLNDIWTMEYWRCFYNWIRNVLNVPILGRNYPIYARDILWSINKSEGYPVKDYPLISLFNILLEFPFKILFDYTKQSTYACSYLLRNKTKYQIRRPRYGIKSYEESLYNVYEMSQDQLYYFATIWDVSKELNAFQRTWNRWSNWTNMDRNGLVLEIKPLSVYDSVDNMRHWYENRLRHGSVKDRINFLPIKNKKHTYYPILKRHYVRTYLRDKYVGDNDIYIPDYYYQKI